MNNDAKEAAPGLSGPAEGRKLFFIRHGRTEWNDQFRYQGATDIPLSEEGRRQARAVGLRMADIKLDALVTSPLARARETASMIASFHADLHPIIVPELIEVNFGGWEGLTVPQIIEKYGQELFDRWRDDPLNTDAPDGEAMDALWERCGAAARAILARPGKKIAIVGHGAMFRALFPKLLRLERTGGFWRSRLDNCSVSTFCCGNDGRVSLSSLNDINHLKIDEEHIKILPEP